MSFVAGSENGDDGGDYSGAGTPATTSSAVAAKATASSPVAAAPVAAAAAPAPGEFRVVGAERSGEAPASLGHGENFAGRRPPRNLGASNPGGQHRWQDMEEKGEEPDGEEDGADNREAGWRAGGREGGGGCAKVGERFRKEMEQVMVMMMTMMGGGQRAAGIFAPSALSPVRPVLCPALGFMASLSLTLRSFVRLLEEVGTRAFARPFGSLLSSKSLRPAFGTKL